MLPIESVAGYLTNLNSKCMKTKIEVNQVSEHPFNWLISFSVEGLTLKDEALKKIPDIIENMSGIYMRLKRKLKSEVIDIMNHIPNLF